MRMMRSFYLLNWFHLGGSSWWMDYWREHLYNCSQYRRWIAICWAVWTEWGPLPSIHRLGSLWVRWSRGRRKCLRSGKVHSLSADSTHIYRVGLQPASSHSHRSSFDTESVWRVSRVWWYRLRLYVSWLRTRSRLWCIWWWLWTLWIDLSWQSS